MTAAEKIAREIMQVLPNVKSGSLRFFGEWFGRPYDNNHTIVDAAAEENDLTVQFDGDEALTVSNPSDVRISENEFEIGSATRVLWKWYYYGREKVPENLRFEKFEVVENKIHVSHNIEWYEPDFRPTLSEPAVRMFSIWDDPTIKNRNT
jgi:hypothetical protein